MLAAAQLNREDFIHKKIRNVSVPTPQGVAADKTYQSEAGGEEDMNVGSF